MISRYPHDRHKMLQFIRCRLPEGYGRLVLANGSIPGDDIVADVTVCGDQIEIESNCPDWVTLEEVYKHLRWQMMPGWEQAQWFKARSPAIAATSRLETVADRLEKIVSEFQPVGTAVITQADEATFPTHRFERVGNIWHTHFPGKDGVEVAHFPDSVLFRQMAMLLGNRDRVVPFEVLAGQDNVETQGLITAYRNQRKELRFAGLSISDLQGALRIKEERVEAARLNGEIDAIDACEVDLRRFHDEVGRNDEDFRRILKKVDDERSLAKTFYKSVSRNRTRLLQKLQAGGMHECAKYLEMTVRRAGNGFVYCPPAPAPDWVLSTD